MESSTDKKGTVYLIHFDKPLKHARHYLGFTLSKTADARIERHRKGKGSRLLKVLNDLRIGWVLARVWENMSRDDERRLKNMKCSPKLCPICKGK